MESKSTTGRRSIFGPLVGRRFAGSCADCDSYDEVTQVGPRDYGMTTRHDTTCPWLRARCQPDADGESTTPTTERDSMTTSDPAPAEAAPIPLADWLDAHTDEIFGVVKTTTERATESWLARRGLATSELLRQLVTDALSDWLDDHSPELIRTIAASVSDPT
ncbi:hypothetical protein ACSW29_12565 [Rhodococcus sp. GB-02]